MSMWPIRLNGVVLHAVAAFTRHLKLPPANLLKCVIKSTQMDLLCFDVWATTKKREKKKIFPDGRSSAHVYIWPVCFNYNRPHNSDPADKNKAAP